MSRKKGQYLKIPLIILGLILLGLLLTRYKDQGTNINNANPKLQESIQTTPKPQVNAQLQSLIDSSANQFDGLYAIYIKDLKSDAIYQINADKTFTSASIYKLAVMYKTYNEIAKGNLKKNDNLTGNKSALDKRILGEDEENFEPSPDDTNQTITFDVKTALFEMITVSDNYSALLLAERLGWKNIDDFLKENSIQNFNLVGENSPNTTALAVGLLLEKIYNNTAVNSQFSQEMKNLLFAQEINDRIPKYLPKDIKVAHKTGELGSIRHDAGIVLGKNSDYIFVFLSDTPEPEEATETIALLSRKIYDELEKIINVQK
ncbi:hypothetical protein A2W45_00025 [Candidatus Curtissbacteria bacterium RIFCSPHIGHO2_12_41_11]|uniref:Beta-lactamase class A catalytic domain-containing protein n=3 Tax=Candidatus Curtissiibacteriota TaxID=1752717 RepID=A0A1F5G8X9_9BACT|nr:MAG: hypothetical protein A3D04_03465 [Candidatus Curtissbacteria bacterium RIFCSPHIGHO2_02_FULL_40_16b]OGD99394.1 MAG: hypothetical protein A2W45_00025 [Candidatus Curtissbacteria bacterium RIFCSPHIGHO2_12_41_11]OGE00231.1 MAG: hypothetical protein A3J17_03770 [Candidatus Curtissbacteria bacterium RIFCSPLOWO2_02_FULL_40_11]OGE12954.1 MAG: hypothetical protein A3G14_02780 [Candidatus Curtissbacteria bacterium RIFCSPLOWO2_12_FULL_38_9]